MNQTERHRRLRLLLKKYNKERKRQASKIDILCNDLVAVQREFLRRVNGVSFAAGFYKDLLGTADLRSLLVRAGRLIRRELPQTTVSFFLRHSEGCELYLPDGDETCEFEEQRLENHITTELAETICKRNRPCTLEDLFGMGLEGNLAWLGTVSAATVPLSDLGRPLGFILIYRMAPHRLGAEEIGRVNLVACGLSRAIRGCAVPLHSRQ